MASLSPAATSGSVGCVFRKKMAANEIAVTAVSMAKMTFLLDGAAVRSGGNEELLGLGHGSGGEPTWS